MSTLSLRLPDELMHDVDYYADQLQIPKAAYVRRAIEQMNASMAVQQKRLRLMEASLKVRGESMKINAEFDAFEDTPDA